METQSSNKITISQQPIEEKIIEGKAKKPIIVNLLLVISGIILFIVDDIMGWWGSTIVYYILLALSILLVISPFILKLTVAKCTICVTDKRVYGIAGWGKRVDLPLDTISAVAMSAFKGISVSTASGNISFLAIENRNKIHSALSNLLVDRQNKTLLSNHKNISTSSNVDELKKYKELLDMGVITQEEFDAKKKQLLGL